MRSIGSLLRSPVRRRRLVRAVLAVAGAVVLFFVTLLVHHALDATRGVAVASIAEAAAARSTPAVTDARFPAVVAVLAGARLTPGNHVRILIDGPETFEDLFEGLRAARRSITFQQYFCGDGMLADTLASILAERARAGVSVRFLADGFGCRSFPGRYAESLRAAGVRVAILRPVRWYTLHKAQHRSHVRIVVIDGEVGYTGGFGIDDQWLNGDRSGRGWRETNVRFSGPTVLEAQGAFVQGWADATGELLAGEALFPADTGGAWAEAPPAPLAAGGPADTAAAASVEAALQFAGPGLGTTPFERLLALTIRGARERLYITNPYFVPSSFFRQLLADAARRGVDVHVVTAGPRTDVPSTMFASRAFYEELLRAGVRIHEYTPTMMHAKTFVVDGIWSAIGTLNFDNRSIRLNEEINLLVRDTAVGRELEEVFRRDLDRAEEMTLERHDARPWYHRVLEGVARLVAPLL